MSENVVELTDQNFSESIKDGTVLVDFWAPWCGPCQMMSPIIESVAGKTSATVAKINVDDHNEAAAQYGVQSIPTLIIFKNGEEAKRFVGVQTEDDLIAALS